MNSSLLLPDHLQKTNADGYYTLKCVILAS